MANQMCLLDTSCRVPYYCYCHFLSHCHHFPVKTDTTNKAALELFTKRKHPPGGRDDFGVPQASQVWSMLRTGSEVSSNFISSFFFTSNPEIYTTFVPSPEWHHLFHQHRFNISTPGDADRHACLRAKNCCPRKPRCSGPCCAATPRRSPRPLPGSHPPLGSWPTSSGSVVRPPWHPLQPPNLRRWARSLLSHQPL